MWKRPSELDWKVWADNSDLTNMKIVVSSPVDTITIKSDNWVSMDTEESLASASITVDTQQNAVPVKFILSAPALRALYNALDRHIYRASEQEPSHNAQAASDYLEHQAIRVHDEWR